MTTTIDAPVGQRTEASAFYFLELALNGQHPGASHGEQAAARIAKGLAALVDDIDRMDRQAVDGLCALVKAAGTGRARFVEELLMPND